MAIKVVNIGEFGFFVADNNVTRISSDEVGINVDPGDTVQFMFHEKLDVKKRFVKARLEGGESPFDYDPQNKTHQRKDGFHQISTEGPDTRGFALLVRQSAKGKEFKLYPPGNPNGEGKVGSLNVSTG